MRSLFLSLLALMSGWSALGAQVRQGTQAVRSNPLFGAILAAEDARVDTPEALTPLLSGLASSDTGLQRMAVRALGRFERASLVPTILPLLSAGSASVRGEAANALGQGVSGGNGSSVSGALRERLKIERDPAARGLMALTLGRITYQTVDEYRVAEDALLDASTSNEPAALLGVARGLDWLVRQKVAPRPVSDRLYSRLRGLARTNPTLTSQPMTPNPVTEGIRIRRLAFLALLATRQVDGPFLDTALTDPDREIRRVAAAATGLLDALDDRGRLIAAALRDTVAQVRYQALGSYGRRMQAIAACGPVLAATTDADPQVALQAFDLLANDCGPDERPTALLNRTAGQLAATNGGTEFESWHRPAHALVSLARVAPDQAQALLPRFMGHRSWLVRMYAAKAAAVMRDGASLERLALDRHDNVREAAVTGLVVVRKHAADSLYLAQLQRNDYQLLRTTAGALEGSPSGASVVPALIAALDRITAHRKENARDARTALLETAGKLGTPANADALRRYLTDFDPAIASQAATIMSGWTGRTETAAPNRLQPRPVPTMAELRRLEKARAIVQMQGGATFELELHAWNAPTTVARFAQLARMGYYNGLTFHRVVPNFVIQGGSPGANEYVGDAQFTRDELTADAHLRGTAGISTRGRDTGDLQIFVNLVDNVRLDHNFTIFADVVRGMDKVEQILEAAVIDRVTIVDAP